VVVVVVVLFLSWFCFIYIVKTTYLPLSFSFAFSFNVLLPTIKQSQCLDDSTILVLILETAKTLLNYRVRLLHSEDQS